jgi:hypothetical protein
MTQILGRGDQPALKRARFQVPLSGSGPEHLDVASSGRLRERLRVARAAVALLAGPRALLGDVPTTSLAQLLLQRLSFALFLGQSGRGIRIRGRPPQRGLSIHGERIGPNESSPGASPYFLLDPLYSAMGVESVCRDSERARPAQGCRLRWSCPIPGTGRPRRLSEFSAEATTDGDPSGCRTRGDVRVARQRVQASPRDLIAAGGDIETYDRLKKHYGSWPRAQEALALSEVTIAQRIEARFRYRRMGKV